MRSFSGCWTCRLRRKKCDERFPICDTCTALHIACHYEQGKPEWMDGGLRQEEMATSIKREIKENAHYRRGERGAQNPDGNISLPKATVYEGPVQPRDLASSLVIPMSHPLHEACNNNVVDRTDNVLIMFYLEHVFSFLFPFYRPPPLQGGKSWILELISSSPVVRQISLCQGSYFFSLARGAANCDMLWETVLAHTRNVFEVLRQAIQLISGSDMIDHMQGAVRILASIVQVQRFDIAVLSFENCRSHLNAAIALFEQILGHNVNSASAGHVSRFNAVLHCLGPSSWISPVQQIQIPSAEQNAFSFSAALLILDDIIASTVLQEEPKLYGYHCSLLMSVGENAPLVDLEGVVGCQNWAMAHIANISVLDAWKQRCKRAGNLDVMELVRRATAIRNSLEDHIARLDPIAVENPETCNSLLQILTAEHALHVQSTTSQCLIITRVWAHAAFLYLSVVVSGWQPANVDVSYHVSQVIDLLVRGMKPPDLLRTVVWPFCVAGCFAQPSQEIIFRELVASLQPPPVFGSVRKALEIMEKVWRNRDAGDISLWDIATCFKTQNDLILLL